jgi:iron complex transport system substrate-binding protein
VACGPTKIASTPTVAATPAASGYPRTVTDARGKQLTLAAPPKRIVSLAPSNTEIVYALGDGDRMVGDTTACDYPPAAKSVQHIGGFQTDIEAVEVLNPDLVIALKAVNGKAIESLESAHVPVLVVDATTIDTTYATIDMIGQATGKNKEASKLIASMRSDLDRIGKAAAALPGRPAVLIAYGAGPIYTTGPGSYIDEVIKIAGGRNIVAKEGQSTISAEEVIQDRPDVIICDPMIEPDLRRIPGWSSAVPAIRNNRFFHTAADTTLVRPGPRLPRAVEELTRYLHPNALKP